MGRLGVFAQDRGEWGEAKGWHRRAITLFEEFGDRPHLVTSYGQLAFLAEERGRPQEALEWVFRYVTLFDQIPHPAAASGPGELRRLTEGAGISAAEDAWQRVTGQPLPDVLRDFLRPG